MGSINSKINKYGSISPGPGAYKPKDINDVQLHFSMGSKLEFGSVMSTNSKAVPGPGNYDPKHVFKYDGHTKFGSGMRPGIYNEKLAKFLPSPFQYKQDAQFI